MIISTYRPVVFAVLVRLVSCGILGSLSKRNNIQYATNSLCTNAEIAKIGESYSDTLRLAQFTLVEAGALVGYPNELVTRFFGPDAVGANSTINSQIRETLANIGSWWPIPFFDWLTGYTITFTCSDTSNTCLANTGGYGSNTADCPIITMCPDFFDDDAYPILDERKEYLDANVEMQKDLKYFGTAGMMILHEMIHLEVISGVTDYTQFTGSINVTFFGPYRASWLANTSPSLALLNADKYAIFATANWFTYYYGLPSPATSTNGFLCTDDIFDINDIPFADGNITYVLNNGTGGGVVVGGESGDGVEWGGVGYVEDDGEIASLVEVVASFTAPPGAGVTGVSEGGWAQGVQGKIMRILPLGDSITNGYQSTDGNGYRLPLYNSLTHSNTITMVGSLNSGTMLENANEGIDGAIISQIATDTVSSLLERPNIILLHAGTNDMNNPTLPSTAPSRLGSLINQCLLACPDAVVLVAKIIPSGTEATMANIVIYNEGVEEEVAIRRGAGKKVVLVDMSHLLNSTDYADDLHPNDGGYAKLAGAWLEGLVVAFQAGWIGIPFGVTMTSTSVVSHTSISTTPIPTLPPTTLTSITTVPDPTTTPTTPSSPPNPSTSCILIMASDPPATGGSICTAAGPPNGPNVCSCLFQDEGLTELMYTSAGDCAACGVQA